MNEHTPGSQRFPTTRWSIVSHVRHGDAGVRHRALGELCQLYWLPVYAYIRSSGHSPHDAEDLTQGLFAELLARDDFSRPDKDKGKLRSFLLAAAKNHIASAARRASRQKRGGGTPPISLDWREAEARLGDAEPADHRSPDRIYDRQWALTVLDHALRQVEERYRNDGKATLFEALKPTLASEGRVRPYAELAAELGTNEVALKTAVHRLRQRFARTLHDLVADTLGPGEDPRQEISRLLAAVD